MNKAYLLIGGNLGDRKEQLAKAVAMLNAKCGHIEAFSSLYETEPWGNQDQSAFLNQALLLNTKLNARQLVRKILSCEKKMGRIRKEKLGPRIIDIDILLFNEEIHTLSFLKIPHPAMQNRRFALEPLSEIAPHLLHPVLKKSISNLLAICPDQLPVKKMN